MSDSFVIVPQEQNLIGLGWGAAGNFAECFPEASKGGLIGGHAVKFDAVAGVEQSKFLQAGRLPEPGGECGGAGGVEREFFPHRQRSGVVAGTEQK